MKGIFITAEGKQELEAKLAVLEIKLENHVQHCKITGGNYDYSFEQALEFAICRFYSNYDKKRRTDF